MYADASVIVHKARGTAARLHLLPEYRCRLTGTTTGGHARIVYADGVTHDLAYESVTAAWREATEEEALAYNAESARLRKPGSYARARMLDAVARPRSAPLPADYTAETKRHGRGYSRRLGEGFAALDGRRTSGW
jgi:hypothetical protein